MFTYTIDVSRRWADDLIPAILVVQSHERLAPRDALSRFRRSVSQWLANTDEGRKSWEASSHDFNYGDFRQDGVAGDKGFLRLLRANGLLAAKVERMEAIDCDEAWDSTFEPEGARTPAGNFPAGNGLSD